MCLRYVGEVSAHVFDLKRATRDARRLGRKLARAARRDAEGRRTWSELARYRAYRKTVWDPYPHYLDNLTAGTRSYDGSMIARALSSGEFTNPEAARLLRRAAEELRRCLRAEGEGEEGAALPHLVKAGAFWTHATWKQLLEEDVIGVATPAVYRPLSSR